MHIYAQGDLLITKVDVSPAVLANAKVVENDPDGAVVLERGEVTGHRHAIYGGGATLFRDDALARDLPSGLYVGHLAVGAAGADVKHEEHASIGLDPGVYRVSRQREASDAEATRIHAD